MVQLKIKFVNVFLVLVLTFISVFFMPVFGSSEGVEESLAEQSNVMNINTAWIDDEFLRIDVMFKTGESSSLVLKLSDYIGDGNNSPFIEIQAVDLEGNQSETIKIDNPLISQNPDEVSNNVSIGVGVQDMLPQNNTGTAVISPENREGLELFTVNTEDGNEFFLFVDRHRTTDNVYLLSLVTESDLLSMVNVSEQTAPNNVLDAQATSPVQEELPLSEVMPEPTQETTSDTQQPTTDNPPETGNGYVGLIIFIVVLLAGAGAAAYYFIVIKGRTSYGETDDDSEEYEEYEYTEETEDNTEADDVYDEDLERKGDE